MDRPKVSQFVLDEFAKIIDSQDKKGFEKYGKTIDEANDEDYNWELMALEETADLQKYLVRRILELKNENRLLNLDNHYLSLRLKQSMEAKEKEIAYLDDIQQMDGMLEQANARIKELEENVK